MLPGELRRIFHCAGLRRARQQVNFVSPTTLHYNLPNERHHNIHTKLMSRALDKGVKEALKNGNHDEIFKTIASVLATQQQDLLEIELLGQSHVLPPATYYMQDGPAVAIPKLRLVQAFISAQAILKRQLRTKSEAGQTVLDATAVMLLMDPEHLTAANARKRLLTDENVTIEDLQHEKYFIDSLLTSRLHRHTKSPTLWNHREWLLKRLCIRYSSKNALDDFAKVILIAAERHPRNYYAWSHARFLRDREKAAGSNVDGLDVELSELTKKWCFSHHDDISGWAFLGLLLRNSSTTERHDIFHETIKLTRSFSWRGESVWYFLRNLALSLSTQETIDLEATRISMLQGVTHESLEKLVLHRAGTWLEDYQIPLDVVE